MGETPWWLGLELLFNSYRVKGTNEIQCYVMNPRIYSLPMSYSLYSATFSYYSHNVEKPGCIMCGA